MFIKSAQRDLRKRAPVFRSAQREETYINHNTKRRTEPVKTTADGWHIASFSKSRMSQFDTNIRKAKLSPKCNLETRVKPLCKSIITTKEALLRFTVFSFLGQTRFQWECYGHFHVSIKISIFKTVRRLETTWNFAGSITRVSTREHQHWEHCLCTQSY